MLVLHPFHHHWRIPLYALRYVVPILLAILLFFLLAAPRGLTLGLPIILPPSISE